MKNSKVIEHKSEPKTRTVTVTVRTETKTIEVPYTQMPRETKTIEVPYYTVEDRKAVH